MSSTKRAHTATLGAQHALPLASVRRRGARGEEASSRPASATRLCPSPSQEAEGRRIAALAAAFASALTLLAPASAQEIPTGGAAFGAVDRERLLAADSQPENWLTTGRDFGKSHYSPLDQINRETIGQLGYAWGYDTLTLRGMEATPIVVDGVMFTSGPTGKVFALNAVTGEEIWTFDPESDGQVNRYTCCDEVNRGVAVWEGMVYVAALDGRLFGLDAATGEQQWVQDTIIYKDRAYTSSGAPEVAGSVVVIGNAGADYDARGYVSAYDLKTGELKWRFFAVPRDPDLGPQEHPELEMALQTWDPESRWDVGGGGTPWDGMVYDPELNLLFVGTGNAALFNWYDRSPSGGDNLFLCSILAINPDTGRLVWHHQQTPRESWDYTAVQPMILADLEWEGQTRKVLMQAPKNGFFYIYDRATGQLLSADPYVSVNWASHVDLDTGRPEINLDLVDYGDGNGPRYVEPSAMGGHNWHPMAYSPDTGFVYIPAIEAGFIIGDLTEGHVYRPKQPNAGHNVMFGDQMLADPSTIPGPMGEALAAAQAAGVPPPSAALRAFNPQTGELVWRRESVGWYDRAGVLATGGGLVFQGTDTGHLMAFDDATGETLLDVNVGTSIMAAPMTYSVDGVQYVAVQAGWGGGGWFAPHETSAAVKYGNFNRILAFRLGGAETPLPPELSTVPVPIPRPPEQTASAEVIEQGRGLFARSCTLCHANRPDGLTPDLRRMSEFTHNQFADIVLRGARRTRSMPQFDDVLNEEQVDAIHAYLVDLAWKAYGAQEAGESPDAGGPIPQGPGDAATDSGTGHN